MQVGGDAGRMPAGVVEALRCPLCGEPFTLEAGLRCPNRHGFDLARQGYVNLQDARTAAPSADTAAMVADRAAFLAAGHYSPMAARVAELAAGVDGLIVDAGAGTGYYLAGVLERAPAAVGLAMDSSTAALKRAARAHPRLGAVAWNVWQPWPVAAHSASVLLNVFAPRNPEQFRRVLRADGVLVVVSPAEAHLAELREWVRMLAVDVDKTRQLDETLAGAFRLDGRDELSVPLELAAEDVRRVVGMGPNAHHQRGAVVLPERVGVTASFVVSVYRPR